MNANIRARLEMQDDEMKPAVVDTTISQKATTNGPSSSVVSMKGEDEEGNKAADELRSFFIKDASKCCRHTYIILTVYILDRVGVDLFAYTTGRGKKFPWLSLLDICAKAGVKLINYPDMVSAPIKPKTGKKSKGIANLSKGHMEALLRQIRHGQKPLSFATRAPDGMMNSLCNSSSNENIDVRGDEVVTLVYLSGAQILTAAVKKYKPTHRKKTSDTIDDDNNNNTEFTDTETVTVKKNKSTAQNKPTSGIIDDYDEEDNDADFTDAVSEYVEESTSRTPRVMWPRKEKLSTVADEFVSMGSPGGAAESRSMERAAQGRKVQGMFMIHRNTHKVTDSYSGVKCPLTSSGNGRDEGSKRRRASPPLSSLSTTDSVPTVKTVVETVAASKKPLTTSAEPDATSVTTSLPAAVDPIQTKNQGAGGYGPAAGPPRNPSSGPHPVTGPPAAYPLNGPPAAYLPNPASGLPPIAYPSNPVPGPPPPTYPPNPASAPPATYPASAPPPGAYAPAQGYPYPYEAYWGYGHGQPYPPPGMYHYPGAVGGGPAGPGVFGPGPSHDTSRE